MLFQQTVYISQAFEVCSLSLAPYYCWINQTPSLTAVKRQHTILQAGFRHCPGLEEHPDAGHTLTNRYRVESLWDCTMR